jgi:hypothetical protein
MFVQVGLNEADVIKSSSNTVILGHRAKSIYTQN